MSRWGGNIPFPRLSPLCASFASILALSALCFFDESNTGVILINTNVIIVYVFRADNLSGDRESAAWWCVKASVTISPNKMALYGRREYVSSLQVVTILVIVAGSAYSQQGQSNHPYGSYPPRGPDANPSEISPPRGGGSLCRINRRGSRNG